MGQSNTTLSHLGACLQGVCNSRPDCYTIPRPEWDASWTKPYNLAHLRKPVAVIRPNDAPEVARAVLCALRLDYKVQAMSGGHSYGNFGQGGMKGGGIPGGGLMIDLMHLQDYSYDVDTGLATFGSGHRLGKLDEKLSKNGRAMAHGTCPGVGIGGHATVGGLGPMSRMWGSALDHVVEVEVATADGKLVRASEELNADLFWAIRGAGASFGIVTEFVVKTHPTPGSVIEYTYSFNFGRQIDMAPVFQQWQELVYDPDLDRRFSTLFIAEPLGALITGTFYGTKEQFEATGIMNRIPSGGTISMKLTDWMGSLAHIAETTGLYLSDLPTHFASKSLAFRKEDKIGPEAIRDMFKYMGDANAGTLLWFVIFNSEGGAVNDIPHDATAYPHRDKLMMYQSYAIGFPKLTRTIKGFVSGVHNMVKKGAPLANTTYAGYIDVSMDKNTAQATYWGNKVPLLQQIKEKWDQNDRFQNPQSVGLPGEPLPHPYMCSRYPIC